MAPAPAPALAAKPSRRTAEDYQALSQLQLFLTRPRLYVGTTEARERAVWVAEAGGASARRTLPLSDALLKIIFEVVENATDQVARGATRVGVWLDAEKNVVTVSNDGETFALGTKLVADGPGGAPRRLHVPQLVFTHFGSGTNFEDARNVRTGAGMNGVGLKCVTALSTRVRIRLCDGASTYEQEFLRNMSVIEPPRIAAVVRKDDSPPGWATTVAFAPDLPRFPGVRGLAEVEPVVRFNLRRSAAFFEPRLRIALNGVAFRTASFEDYVRDVHGAASVCVRHGAWRVGWALTPCDQFAHDSCVNGIDTWAGGPHVDAAAEAVAAWYVARLKARKPPVAAAVGDVRGRLLVVVFLQASQPSFTTQTKNELDLKVDAKTRRELAEAVTARMAALKNADPTGLLDDVAARVEARANAGANRQLAATKRLRIEGLYDAEKLGERATLVICEGDSAQTAALAGRSVVGAARLGVTTTRGKIYKVFGRKLADALKHEGIRKLVAAVGLRVGMAEADAPKLRYGRVLLMMDQDDHGAHITSLVLGLFAEYWPWFLRQGRVSLLATPLVKVLRGERLAEVAAFFAERDFEAWRNEQGGRLPPGAFVRYYKGLGSSDPEEQKAWFRQLGRYEKRLVFDEEGSAALRLFLDPKRADDRKRWMDDEATAREVDFAQPSLAVADFCGGPLRGFARMQTRAMIASGRDGLKPVQRKIVMVAMREARGLKRGQGIKVQQLAGLLPKLAQYHHGAEAAMDAVMLMAATYANNLPLLRGHGAFGTRRGGKSGGGSGGDGEPGGGADFRLGADAASPRYVSVSPAPLLRLLLRPEDDCLLRPTVVDGEEAEPEEYFPLLPLVLCNGTKGLGVGHVAAVPPFCPARILRALQRQLRSSQPLTAEAWDEAVGPPRFPGFAGSVERAGSGWRCRGALAVTGRRVVVSELPAPTSFLAYKHFLDGLADQGLLGKLRDLSDDSRPRFEFEAAAGLPVDDVAALAKRLQLDRFVPMALKLWDGDQLRVYASVGDFMQRWFVWRLGAFEARRERELRRMAEGLRDADLRVRFLASVVEGRAPPLRPPFPGRAEFRARAAAALGEPEPRVDALLDTPAWQLTAEGLRRARDEAAALRAAREAYESTSAAELYARELAELAAAMEGEGGGGVVAVGVKRGGGGDAAVAARPAKAARAAE